MPITSHPGIERQPAISPDGDQVAYSWNGPNQDNFDIYVQLIGAGEPLRLTTNPAEESHPAWSPDGLYIAFLRQQASGFHDVIMVPALGGAERKLGESPLFREPIFGLSWSPDGRFLALVDEVEGDAVCGIFSLSVETGEKRQLTKPSSAALADGHPSFSPDGLRLVFGRKGPERGVYLLNLAEDGGPDGEPRRLTYGHLGVIQGLAWRKDGRSIVFSSRTGAGPTSLWQVRTSGGEPEPLGVGAGNGTSPSIARSGNRLVYEQLQSDSNIWRAPLGPAAASAGAGPKAERFIESTRGDHWPHFSSDGSKIVFLSHRSGTQEVWIADADGMNPVRVTSFEQANQGPPRWSPDGRWIVLNLPHEGGGVDIYVVSAAGGAPRQLTEGTYRDVRPAWSQDSRWIYFGSERSGEYQIWKVALEGGEPEQVTRNGGREARESLDGAFVYYIKVPPMRGIWRVPVGGVEEERFLERGFQGSWEIAEEGIYLENWEALPAPTVELYRFATKSVETVAVLSEDTMRFRGFTVSPDGRWVLYGREEDLQSDIMLVEGFK